MRLRVVRVAFPYKHINVNAMVYLGSTEAQGDDPDVVIDMYTDLVDGPDARLERILEEKAIEEAYSLVS